VGGKGGENVSTKLRESQRERAALRRITITNNTRHCPYLNQDWRLRSSVTHTHTHTISPLSFQPPSLSVSLPPSISSFYLTLVPTQKKGTLLSPPPPSPAPRGRRLSLRVSPDLSSLSGSPNLDIRRCSLLRSR